MARINKKFSSPVPSNSSGEEDLDFIDEMIDGGFGGCEMSEILMEMLRTVICNQNPFNVSLSGPNEDRILGLFGYDLHDLAVREMDGHVEHYVGAIKRGESVPKRTISRSEYEKYVKKAVLDRESQELIVKIMGWLISKFNGNDLGKS